jgi:phage virion morphogenesis protein
MSVRFELDAKDALEALNDLVNSLVEPKEILEAIGEDLQRSTVARFSNTTDPKGEKWLDLKSVREGAARRRRVLTKTGKLRKSIRFSADDESVVVGTNVEYGKYHQLGTSNIPQREFLGLSDSDLEAIRDRIIEWIQQR